MMIGFRSLLSMLTFASTAIVALGCAPSQQAAKASPPKAAPDVARDEILAVVPQWESGAGFALRITDKAAGKPVTYIFATKSPPEWRERAKGWVTIAKAMNGDKVVATAVITLTDLHPGRFAGGGTRRDCFVGLTMRDVPSTGTADYTFAPDFAWSNTETGFCDVELVDGKRGGQLEGRVRAKLFTNAGDNSYVIDTGYVYIVR